MLIVRTEYCREETTFSPVGFRTQSEVESSGYVPVAAVPPQVLENGLSVWLFETTRANVRPQQTWLSELRAGCASCLAPEEFHTGRAYFIGENPAHGQGICRHYEE